LPLSASQTLDVAVSAHAFDGEAVRRRVSRHRRLRATTLCVPLGNTELRRC